MHQLAVALFYTCAVLSITVAALCTNPNLKLVQRWRGLPQEPVLRVV